VRHVTSAQERPLLCILFIRQRPVPADAICAAMLSSADRLTPMVRLAALDVRDNATGLMPAI
jgi:hypothetical protein